MTRIGWDEEAPGPARSPFHGRGFAAFMTCAVLFAYGTTPSVADGNLEAAYARFLDLWPGTYGNVDQADEQVRTAGKALNPSTRLFIRRVDLPAFGPDAFYAEWRSADGNDKLMRQRIYAFSIDRARNALRLGLHIWPAANPKFVARTERAYLEPARLTGITPADMEPLSGCDVFFTADGKGFSGAMDKGTCAFDAPDGTPIYSWSQMKIDATAFSYLDGWFRPDGSVYMRFSPDWYVFARKGSDIAPD